MAAIKSRGNRSTEEAFLSILRQIGCKGWRRHLPIHGRPDFSFPKVKVAIFVNGCFWHGCPRCFKLPKRNIDYWTEKIGRNVKRDERNARLLRSAGWSVMHVWEHSLKERPVDVARRVSRFVLNKQLGGDGVFSPLSPK